MLLLWWLFTRKVQGAAPVAPAPVAQGGGGTIEGYFSGSGIWDGASPLAEETIAYLRTVPYVDAVYGQQSISVYDAYQNVLANGEDASVFLQQITAAIQAHFIDHTV